MTPPDEEYPAFDLAYDFVLPSYQWAAQRYDSMDGRIQGVQLVSLSVFAALSGVGRLISGADVSSPFFVLAVAYLALLLIWGFYARQSKTVTLIDPKTLYRKRYADTKPEFKRIVLYWAGEHFSKNRHVVERKWAHVNCMTVLLVLIIAALLAWIWGADMSSVHLFSLGPRSPLHSTPVSVSSGGGGGGGGGLGGFSSFLSSPLFC